MPNKTLQKARGEYGESAAAEFLKQKGFSLIARNLHVSHNEIDIIAENEEYIVFAEVKTRTVPYLKKDGSSPFAVTPAMAVTKQKQKRMVASASQYLLEHPSDKQPRLDVIEVYLRAEADTFTVLKIHHIEDAVWAS